MFRLVAFEGRSAMGWSVPFSLGEFLVEGPFLPVVPILGVDPKLPDATDRFRAREFRFHDSFTEAR